MIALCALFTALAPFNSRQLFQFSMQLFYDPTHLVLFLHHLRVNRTWGTIRDDPFNVAVRGDHLEKLHFKLVIFIRLLYQTIRLAQLQVKVLS